MNPFNVGFGKRPMELLSRNEILDEIAPIFESENPTSDSFVITGPRGSGKTIALDIIKDYFDEKTDWIAVNLNPYMEMHEQLAARIYDSNKFRKVFVKSEFSFSFHGINFSVSGDEEIKDITSYLTKMLGYLKKKNIKLLVCVDDLSSNENVRSFIYSFQYFLREGYNIFLLGTGLYKNVCSLQNNKSLTFLIRTPKALIKPLKVRSIYLTYKRLLNVNDETAIEMAKLSNGYAYGFQLLGSIFYENSEKYITDRVLEKLDITLDENVYSMIWEEMTPLEKDIASYVALHENCTIEGINTALNLKGNSISTYKKSLVYNGVFSDTRGKFEFYLPRFKEFVIFQNKL